MYKNRPCVGQGTAPKNEPYPQLRHEIKMASVVWGLCTENLWRCYRFAMNDIKKSKNLSGEVYIQSSNTNSPGIIKTSQKIERFKQTRALALDDCIYASPERFLDFLMSFIVKR